ncbi:MAG TPA: glycerophosphodiester phosphodiesterase family protein [Bosea sp. (in: a-proteobacteria)]|jgi:glycerophosphoryl diester phosphodiesterase|uniref:glycerophosphodiester phosphodiesterase n=1 Tax=Bosea sp. (in: a-proteobacteria) TaxID=1871050 RepID=UPI002E15698D|nr:glycerophosphodiester phosphodiesterase family protein [Bosea sp. (in: a-proteobacteria)]
MTDIASHRGGARLWPENSRLAFRNSAALSVDFIEFDIHRSRDGVLFVHHDAVLGRTAAGSGPVGDKDWAELRSVGLIGTEGETIPSLDEVLDILAPSGIRLRIELKARQGGERYPGIEAQLVARLKERFLLDRTVFTSFDLPTLAELSALAPDTPAIWLIAERLLESSPRDVRALCHMARAVGVKELAVRVSAMHDDDVVVCREEGVRLGFFAAHDEPAIRKAFAARASAFTTDRPDLAIELKAQCELAAD